MLLSSRILQKSLAIAKGSSRNPEGSLGMRISTRLGPQSPCTALETLYDSEGFLLEHLEASLEVNPKESILENPGFDEEDFGYRLLPVAACLATTKRRE